MILIAYLRKYAAYLGCWTSKGSDQTACIGRLVLAYAGHTYHIVGNLMLRLMYGNSILILSTGMGESIGMKRVKIINKTVLFQAVIK